MNALESRTFLIVERVEELASGFIYSLFFALRLVLAADKLDEKSRGHYGATIKIASPKVVSQLVVTSREYRM